MTEPPVEPSEKGLTVQRRLVAWDPLTGEPITKSVPMLPKEQLRDIALAAMSLPYAPGTLENEIADAEFRGMTNAEVMLIKMTREAAATGDSDLVEKLLDRVLGRPKQSSEVLKVHANYEDYLKSLAAKTPAPAEEAIPVKAEPVGEIVDILKDDIFK